MRKTTANDLCLLELGVPPLKALVKQRQHVFFTKMINGRSSVYHGLFVFAYELTHNLNLVTYRSINNVWCFVIVIVVLKTQVLKTGRTKFIKCIGKLPHTPPITPPPPPPPNSKMCNQLVPCLPIIWKCKYISRITLLFPVYLILYECEFNHVILNSHYSNDRSDSLTQ